MSEVPLYRPGCNPGAKGWVLLSATYKCHLEEGAGICGRLTFFFPSSRLQGGYGGASAPRAATLSAPPREGFRVAGWAPLGALGGSRRALSAPTPTLCGSPSVGSRRAGWLPLLVLPALGGVRPPTLSESLPLVLLARGALGGREAPPETAACPGRGRRWKRPLACPEAGRHALRQGLSFRKSIASQNCQFDIKPSTY